MIKSNKNHCSFRLAMIRRPAIGALSALSKAFRHTHLNPNSAILRPRYEANRTIIFVGKENERKLFHSLTNGANHHELSYHDPHNNCTCCLKQRNISTEPGSKAADAEPDDEQAGAAGDGITKQVLDPEKDRTKIISVETSIRYLQSDAYKTAYGNKPVWVPYRRNFKGQFAPKKTRKMCIRNGMISCGNPCPICRDEYLVLDYRNVDLLRQFISPYNGEILGWDKTGLCRRKQFDLELAITKAKDYGTITFDSKFREYDYEDFYPKEVCETLFPRPTPPV